MLRATCPNEIDEAKVLASLANHSFRDQALVVTGFETGLRISELCALEVGAVWRDGACLSTLRCSRSQLKGGRGLRARSVASRCLPINERLREYLSRFLSERENAGPLNPRAPLFPSAKGRGRQPIERRHAWRLIRGIFLSAGLDPAKTWSGHSLRRRFVRRVFDASDLEIARVAVGHASAITTCAYLFLGGEAADRAILQIGRTGGAGSAEILPAAGNSTAALPA
jgi:site-specific recombinase XerD